MGAADGQGLDAAGEGIAVTIKGYDAWKLQGPDDDRCPECGGNQMMDCMNCGGWGEVADSVECPICEGTGKVECETCAEPDGDYAYEQYRDRQMEELE